MTEERTGQKGSDTTERLSCMQERIPEERWARPREADGPGGLGYLVFKTGSFA